MDQSAAHAGYVYASYGLTALVMAGLLAWTLIRSRRLVRELASRNLPDPGQR